MTSKSKTTKTATATPAMTPRKSAAAQERQWQARSDLQTIQSAQAIQADKSRMAAAQKEAAAQVKALQSLGKK